MDVKHNHRHSVYVINELSIQLMVSNEVYLPFSIYSLRNVYHLLVGEFCGLKCGYGIGMPVDSILEIQLSVNGSKVIKVRKQCSNEKKKNQQQHDATNAAKRMYRIACQIFDIENSFSGGSNIHGHVQVSCLFSPPPLIDTINSATLNSNFFFFFVRIMESKRNCELSIKFYDQIIGLIDKQTQAHAAITKHWYSHPSIRMHGL